MQLKISHVTDYTYAQPVRYALQRLRLTPQNSPLQTVSSWNTEVDGGSVEARYIDHYGNVVELVSASRDTEAISVVASGVVETYDKIGVFGPHKGYMPLWLYQRESPLTKPGKTIRELARGIEKGEPLDQLHSLKTALHKAMSYVPGATQTQTLAEDALASGQGVCQDHAQTFVAAARLMSFPARYVSGYLMMEETVNQAASHAWAEAHVDGLGWVGFDPANDISPDHRYVHIAYGLDYRDAAPISGIRTGFGEEQLAVRITVEQ
ncbi:Transglutaminase-like enzyme, putative cysteine protease [Hoeflea phototrophica DFL-43]|jgi:transglutaminase-like putative cysteine protease|uniref:Transglutaminase-like enzyme, putative cysteine protease n=1 Tax=Hoeflea phototrophica (strain DSM 17068 / NCIMB 14078 / DFL-43) TaxID=411684 RepID=A9DDC9_HOEPD|nr:transglutaminase family protein [Hoeflea phototrophica]EDQ32047.1 Transglutaminase-like enzyme, putative cysteine protease [Hoeflea phototrophica DFL-43]